MAKKTTSPAIPEGVTVTRKRLADYIPDRKNANKGTERGSQFIENSLRRTGAGRSLVADKNGNLPAGNKTFEAAAAAGFEEVIEIESNGKALIVHKRTDWDLTDDNGAAREYAYFDNGAAREYAYFDNRASELSLNWDASVIAADHENGVDLTHIWTPRELDIAMIGAGQDDDPEDDDRYSRKIEIPLYVPSEEKPAIEDLYNDEKTLRLIGDIEAAEALTDDERYFLTVAAQRHTVLNFAKIADLYAHGTPTLQRLMEDSALVILDYDRAIELGYVKLSKQIAEVITDETDR